MLGRGRSDDLRQIFAFSFLTGRGLCSFQGAIGRCPDQRSVADSAGYPANTSLHPGTYSVTTASCFDHQARLTRFSGKWNYVKRNGQSHKINNLACEMIPVAEGQKRDGWMPPRENYWSVLWISPASMTSAISKNRSCACSGISFNCNASDTRRGS